MIEPTVAAVAAQIDPATAQRALAELLAVAGSSQQWDYNMLDGITEILKKLVPQGLPLLDSQTAEAMRFWTAVAESR